MFAVVIFAFLRGWNHLNSSDAKFFLPNLAAKKLASQTKQPSVTFHFLQSAVVFPKLSTFEELKIRLSVSNASKCYAKYLLLEKDMLCVFFLTIVLLP